MGVTIPRLEEANTLIENYLKKHEKSVASKEAVDFMFDLTLLDQELDDNWIELLDIKKRGFLVPNLHPNMSQKVINNPAYDTQYSANTANEVRYNL